MCASMMPLFTFKAVVVVNKNVKIKQEQQLKQQQQDPQSAHSKPLKAGGISSLTSTLKHIIKSQQPQTNLKNLFIANKDKGFDCPGCAWGDKQEGFLHFHLYEEQSDTFINRYGICESRETEQRDLTELDILLVPLLAFTEDAHRLGMGKAYYDKTFEHLK